MKFLITENQLNNLTKFIKVEQKSLLKEMGPNIASRAFSNNSNRDSRGLKVRRDVITSLFSNYIGRQIPFYVKILNSYNPIRFDLIEVQSDEFATNLVLHFHNQNGVDDEALFADNKKDFAVNYDVKTDQYDFTRHNFLFNRYAVNLFINAAKIIRQIYYKLHPVMKYVDSRDGHTVTPEEFRRNPDYYGQSKPEIDIEKTKEIMQTKLKPSDFRQFAFDGKNLLNRDNY